MKLKKITRTLPFRILLLTVAGIINAVGVTVFLAPIGLLDGGFSGTSVFLSTLTPIPLGVFLLVLNLPFFLFAFRRFGLRFVATSIYAVFVYAASTLFIQTFFDVATSSPIAGTDFVLCAIFGGLLSGVGSGMTIYLGGALDGVEILAVTFAKRLGLTVGTFVMLYNCVIFILAGIIENAWSIPLYSVIAYTVGIKTIDYIVEGLDKAKAALVITEKKEEVARICSRTFGCGITVLPAEGYYSSRGKSVLYIVVNRFEIPTLKRLTEEADPSAFITILDISDVMGSELRRKKAARQNGRIGIRRPYKPPLSAEEVSVTPSQEPLSPQEVSRPLEEEKQD